VFNGAATIGETLDSTLSLGISTSVIVVDDGSRDTTLEVVVEWARMHGSKLSSLTILALNDNWGLATARNTAVEAVNTDYFIPLDADNLLNSNAVAPLLREAVASQADVLHGPIKRFKSDRGLMGSYPLLLSRLSESNYIDALALVKKDLWLKVGGYTSLSVQGLEDYDFWLKAIRVGAQFKYGQRILGFYRVDPKSMIHSMPHGIALLSREELLFRHPEYLRPLE
jgi:GT2 family glycosyltransferase